jgi:hypothetical protein
MACDLAAGWRRGVFGRLIARHGMDWAARNWPFLYACIWPGAGAPSIDFTAALPTVNLYLQRLLWGRQIEQSSGRISLMRLSTLAIRTTADGESCR